MVLVETTLCDLFFIFSPCRHPFQPYPLIAEGLEQPGCRKSPQHHHFVEMVTSLLYNNLGKKGS